MALTNLCDEDPLQLVLPFERGADLDRTLDAVRERFGAAAIRRGALVGREAAPWVPSVLSVLHDLAPRPAEFCVEVFQAHGL